MSFLLLAIFNKFLNVAKLNKNNIYNWSFWLKLKPTILKISFCCCIEKQLTANAFLVWVFKNWFLYKLFLVFFKWDQNEKRIFRNVIIIKINWYYGSI